MEEADPAALAAAAANLGRTVQQHKAKQLRDDYADDLVLGTLARIYERKTVVVVNADSIRTFTSIHVDVDGA
eukprot:7784476-Pyramimonas_sp.AAC.1